MNRFAIERTEALLEDAEDDIQERLESHRELLLDGIEWKLRDIEADIREEVMEEVREQVRREMAEERSYRRK